MFRAHRPNHATLNSCPQCGVQAAQGDLFCAACGTSLAPALSQEDGNHLKHRYRTSRRKWAIASMCGALVVAAAIVFGVPQIRNRVLGQENSSLAAPQGDSQPPATTGTPGGPSPAGAYQQGEQWGQQITSNDGASGGQFQKSEFMIESSCQSNRFSSTVLNTEFFNGCMAGAGY